jgi:N-acetylglucosaminyl-diphospho-decaprenol L-rhamnosyltransferase
MSPPIDVVVVNYNSAKYLQACLSSVHVAFGDLEKAGYPRGRVVVVDNASTDDSRSIALRADVHWVATGENLGFGRAANRGIAATNAPFVLLLNPDLEVASDTCVMLLARMERDESIGAIGPAVKNLDGSVYPSARSFPNIIDAIGHAFVGLVFPNNPWSRRYLNPDQIDWVSGTAMLLRRSALDGSRGVGGFDEDYFMYTEDVDLCWRLAALGWRTVYEPTASVIHHIGGSSEGKALHMIVEHHRSLFRFERRTAKGSRRLLLPFVAVGLALRAVSVVLVRSVRKRPPASFHRSL